ncbi:uncharacterized protein BKA78DRAFT_56721 [Phyllosticta capitalensis]|uniref:uncharacterized protein n=1 Tax=Phyllosticta capitalensis TaxID=121624 RepID=UPI00312DF5EB
MNRLPASLGYFVERAIRTVRHAGGAVCVSRWQTDRRLKPFVKFNCAPRLECRQTSKNKMMASHSIASHRTATRPPWPRTIGPARAQGRCHSPRGTERARFVCIEFAGPSSALPRPLSMVPARGVQFLGRRAGIKHAAGPWWRTCSRRRSFQRPGAATQNQGIR